MVRDIWISGSGYNGSYGKALIENHDKLTLLRLVGVPTPVPGHDSRWYVYRVADSLRNFRDLDSILWVGIGQGKEGLVDEGFGLLDVHFARVLSDSCIKKRGFVDAGSTTAPASGSRRACWSCATAASGARMAG